MSDLTQQSQSEDDLQTPSGQGFPQDDLDEPEDDLLDDGGSENEDEDFESEDAGAGDQGAAGDQGPANGYGGSQAEPSQASQVAPKPVPTPDIPGTEAILQSDIDELAPLIDPTLDTFDPVQYTRRLMAITQNTVRNEMQATSSAQMQMTRLLAGRQELVERYGAGISRNLQQVAADKRHQPGMIRAALFTEVVRDSETRGDEAVEDFIKAWNGSKKQPAPRQPQLAAPQRTPVSTGGGSPSSVTRSSSPIDYYVKEYGLSREEAEEAVKTPGVVKGTRTI
jgi:hypothetical protein